MKPKRILFAAVDTNYRMAHYAKFIATQLPNTLKADTFSKVVLPPNHYATSYTYTCPIYEWSALRTYIYCACFFVYSLCVYDVFHFIAGENILTRKLRKLELSIYQLLGKRVIMHFAGADVRSNNYIDWKREHIVEYLSGVKNTNYTEPFQDALIKNARKYGNAVLVSTPDMLDIIPEATYYPVVLDMEQVNIKLEKSTKKIKILYSPSSHRTKGSDYIHMALEAILANNANDVELITPSKLITNTNQYSLTRYELLQQMSQAHIVIDQLIIGWYGLKTIEALALGCEVVCYIDDAYAHNLFDNCPIHNANVNNLQGVIQSVIHKVKANKLLPNTQTIQWVKKHHTIEQNNTALKKAWGV
ncbi:MAG: hypothetical protein H7331_02485 [Bacteroidia bacterium]|nr:hypothetical protein [Bacteroidia bacterium]